MIQLGHMNPMVNVLAVDHPLTLPAASVACTRQ